MMITNKQGVKAIKQAIGAMMLWLLVASMTGNAALAESNILSPKADDIIEGNPSAPLKMVIYYSPTCHHCHDYFKKVMPSIRERYIKTGQMCAITREVIGNRQDYIASLIARCKQDKSSYLTFTNQLVQKGTSWAYNKNYESILKDIALDAGIAPEECQACINDKELQDMVLSATQQLGKLPEFIGVPSIYINGELFDKALDTDSLCREIDGCLMKL